jgi:sigma-E factor negative regulatory protein RseA
MNKTDDTQDTEDGLVLSSLWDGEASDADAALALSAYGRDAEARDRWRTYAIVGAALRNDVAVHVNEERLARVMHAVQQQPLVPDAAAKLEVRPPVAANDAVWRWKMVAGVAGATAIGALSWGMLRDNANMPGEQRQWAGGSTPSVVASTPSGAMLRNPDVEALLAEHRLYGGMSAVQVSSGFLRNATYELPSKR